MAPPPPPKMSIFWSPEFVTVIFCGKGEFADVIKDLEMGRLFGWAQCDHKGPCKSEAEGSEPMRRVRRCSTVGFEEGWWDHCQETQAASGSESSSGRSRRDAALLTTRL